MAEHQIVDLDVVGSSPIRRPYFDKRVQLAKPRIGKSCCRFVAFLYDLFLGDLLLKNPVGSHADSQ